MGNLQFDSNVGEIVTIAENLRSEYRNYNSNWVESPFAWIKDLPSRTIGKVGEQLVEQWCTSQNFDVRSSPNSQSDRLINGLRVEIKFSTLWQTGIYKFQQLRDQAYDIVICLGLSPYDIHCWVLSKDVILEQWRSGKLGQHGGRDAQDTAWITVNPKSPQIWLTPRNGKPADAIQILRQFTEEASRIS